MTTIKLFKSNVRSFLPSFLDENAPRTVFFLHRLWKEQENAITYKDLREALLSGEINTEWFGQWQQDYSQFVTEHLQPLWISAMQEAAERQKEKSSGWKFDAASEGIKRWTSRRGAAFVTNSTETQIKALRAAVHHIAGSSQNVDELARLVRPMIGLTKPQTIANANYVKQLQEKKLPPKRVANLAAKYAARQHRYRAQMIARTELAFAFNQGMLEWARQAQAEGYLGKAVKVWSAACDKRSCSVCLKLHGTEVPLDEPFPFETRLSDLDARLAPPAHPMCRCAIDIKEIEPPPEPDYDEINEIESEETELEPLQSDGRYDTIDEIPEHNEGAGNEPSGIAFDIEAAKKEYAKILPTIPEKNREYLEQSLQAIMYEQTDNPEVVFAYKYERDVFLYNPSHVNFKFYDFNIIATHELAHRIDYYFVRSWESKALSDAIQSAQKIFNKNPSMFIQYSYENDMFGYISDIFSAICCGKYKLPYGHREKYWSELYKREKEVFANLFSIEAIQDNDDMQFLINHFPNLVESFYNLEYLI